MAMHARKRDRYNLANDTSLDNTTSREISDNPEDRIPSETPEEQPIEVNPAETGEAEAVEISNPEIGTREETAEELEGGGEVIEETIADALSEIQNADTTTTTTTQTKTYDGGAPIAKWNAEQLQYIGKSTDDILNMFGGRTNRGSISMAIRGLIAAGFTKGDTAKMLNRRYQHVRNVLIETARSEEAKARLAARNVK